MDDTLTIDEAITLVESRNGIPRENDWDLLEAAKVLVVALQQIENRLLALVEQRKTMPPDLYTDGRIQELRDLIGVWCRAN